MQILISFALLLFTVLRFYIWCKSMLPGTGLIFFDSFKYPQGCLTIKKMNICLAMRLNSATYWITISYYPHIFIRNALKLSDKTGENSVSNDWLMFLFLKLLLWWVLLLQEI